MDTEKKKRIERLLGLLLLVIGLILIVWFIVLGIGIVPGDYTPPLMLILWDIFISVILLVIGLFLLRISRK